MPLPAGPTAVLASLPRWAGTACSASLVSGFQGRVLVHTHVCLPFCQLTAEDDGQLQISIISCLKKLFLLLGINQPITGYFVPLVIPKPRPRKST